ncbi:MAG: hypothetical protein AAF456_06570 [Planctomycetota bacterium]
MPASQFNLGNSLAATLKTVLPVILIVICSLAWRHAAAAQDSAPTAAPSTRSSDELLAFVPDDGIVTSVRLGFDGNLKLGHFSPVTFSFTSEAGSRPVDRFEITCRDGDDTPVTYQGELLYSAGQSSVAQGWVRPGRNGGTIAVRLLSGEEEKDAFEIPVISSTATNIAATQPLILAVDIDSKFVELVEDSILADERYAPMLVRTHDLHELPLTAFSYDSISMVMIPVDTDLPAETAAKLREWVADGGHLILIAGGERVVSDSLAELVPGEVDGTVETDGDELRRLAKVDTPLVAEDGQMLLVANIESANGITTLFDDEVPVIVRAADCFGKVTFCAVDLTSAQFQEWPGAKAIIREVFDGTLDRRSNERDLSDSVLHSGYEDMTGQLRAPLDRFSDVRFISFTGVALLIGLFILCVGPGDYFLLRKVFGKMELTWVTLGLMATGFCVLAWLAQKYTKPDSIRINQVEIVDIDVASGTARGSIWSNMYSPATEEADLKLAATTSTGMVPASSLLTWHGIPGNGLGGMQNISAAALFRQEYSLNIDDPGGNPVSELSGVPLRVASSRGFFSRWRAENSLPINHNLTFDLANVATAKLDGSFTNPFDQRLKNCRIMYREWVYVLARPLEPGETIDIKSEMDEKTANNYFSRRVAEESKGTTSAWDPGDLDLGRITDVMMFYRLSGGLAFTGLTHSYQSYFDLSHLPDLNRAVFVAELDVPATGLEVDGTSDDESFDRKFTIIRLVLPVKTD